jgi:pimeloyl-ACP methyl ester carboxylesterase
MRRTLGALVLLALGCGGSGDRFERTLALESCRLEGLGRPALCGVLERPENPGQPEGRTVPIHVAVVPADDPGDRPPVVLLAGGPGQGAIAAWPPILGQLGFTKGRDVVLVDQRGTGSSRPLQCPQPETLAEKLRLDYGPDRLRACLERFEASPEYFTTTVAADDLDAVREALGYPTLDLIGGSYGTRAAMVYLRQHPERVRTVVLDGLAPVDFALGASFATDGQRAFDLLAADCDADPACRAAFGDVGQTLRRVLDAVGDETTVRINDPRSGESVEVRLDRDLVAGAVRGLLYQPTIASVLPLTLERALAGDFSPLVAQATLFSDGLARNFAEGMFLSVICAEDVPFIPDDTADAQETYLGDAVVRELRQACKSWPKADLDDGYRDPVHSDVPVLLLSGELDPVTPPRWGEHAARTLSRSRHVVVPGTGHGTLHVGCVPDIVQTFLDTADPQAPEADCVEAQRRPPFFVDAAGPPQ